MYLLKSLKKRILIRLMTVLGFSGMAASCIKERGLECSGLIVSDGAAGLTTAMAEVLPAVKWQH